MLPLMCDRVVAGGILFLIIFTPLAFGAVHPWAFSLMEVVIFLLVVVWMSRLLVGTREQKENGMKTRRDDRRLVGRMFLPLALFIAFILLQLLPLPPALLHVLSPSTYELYTRTFPGWPQQMPDASVASIASIALDDTEETQSRDERNHAIDATNARDATPQETQRRNERNHAIDATNALWLPLSLAPSLLFTDLLKFLAYASLFSLVLLYPFGAAGGQPGAEERFFRLVLLMILCTGLFVAALGVVQQFTWNGKILWFFVPYNWGAPRPGLLPRTSGPFINSDHFANYLALVFPVALAGILSGSLLFRWRETSARRDFSEAERFFCSLTIFFLTLGILLSLSRGGWIGAALGGGFLCVLLLLSPPERRPALLRQPRKLVVGISLSSVVLLVGLALFFAGSAGRERVDMRLEQTVTEETSLWVRVEAWKDCIGMIRDFPVFGVGLGAWPELFPRYQQPPWFPNFFLQAHNDYVEFLAEMGVIGFGLLAWFFWQGGQILVRGLKTVPPRAVPLFAALVAALGSMAFHEFFDFNLQIPANAFLFTLLFALALRLAVNATAATTQPRDDIIDATNARNARNAIDATTFAIGVIALVLCVLALRQESLPYPHRVKEPTSLIEARKLLLSYPAHAALHLSLFRFLYETENVDPHDWLRELEIAVWLDPLGPRARDLYAAGLAEQGREEEGLQEMARSVFFAPSRSAHRYLQVDWVSDLAEPEQKAVEAGYKQALAAGYKGAVGGLGSFYAAVERFADEGKVYEEAALREEDTEVRAHYFLNAGLAYAKAEEREKAEALFRQAAQVAPQDPRAYQYLATQVFAPQGDVASAKAVIVEGKKNGADSFLLLLALAQAAQKAGDRREARAVLQEALMLRPSSFEAHLRLGLLYLQERKFDRAVLSLRRATTLRPDDASAFYQLGMAEEGRYKFFEAQKAYARAVALAPDNTGFRTRYEAFLHKVAKHKGP